jgi:hypothetical protein
MKTIVFIPQRAGLILFLTMEQREKMVSCFATSAAGG